MYLLDGKKVVIVGTIVGEHVYSPDGKRSRLHKVQIIEGENTGELTLAHRHKLKELSKCMTY